MMDEIDDDEIEINEGGQLDVLDIDELENTSITVACYRETHRLERMLRVYQKALTLAHVAGERKGFKSGLLKLHDHKGILTATWVSVRACQQFHRYVAMAWEDECECAIANELPGGIEIQWPDVNRSRT